MATWETVREIMAALPGTELDPPDIDNPAWRVRGKVLVRRNPSLTESEAAARQEGGEVIAVRVARGEREALLQQDPATFFITPHWQSNPSVLLCLGTVQADLLRELITDA